MNNVAVLANPLELIDAQSVGLIGLPAEKPAQRSLPGAADDLLRSISQMLDRMILEVISKRTATEFKSAQDQIFADYVSLSVAFARVASKAIDRKAIAKLNAESFCELEAEIRENGEACFGLSMKERATFTVWMLRKISDLLGELQTGKLDDGHEEQDKEFAKEFFLHAIVARFYVDCLIISMRTKTPLYEDVLPTIDHGLKAIVNAYAWVKQAVDLRFPRQHDDSVIPEWTDEDDLVVASGIRDFSRFADD
jgi:hypothetical protein